MHSPSPPVARDRESVVPHTASLAAPLGRQQPVQFSRFSAGPLEYLPFQNVTLFIHCQLQESPCDWLQLASTLEKNALIVTHFVDLAQSRPAQDVLANVRELDNCQATPLSQRALDAVPLPDGS